MAGLESIALAVDFLEQREENARSFMPSSSISSSPPEEAAIVSPIPPRSSFLNAPRRVSSDSVCEDRNSPSPGNDALSLPPKDPLSGEILTSDVIARMIEKLSDEGEFQGKPPVPPAPTDVITKVLDCDVLCGRGGETNHHSGNVKYRCLVKKYQPLYIMSKRRDKPLIASKIVRLVRHMGGRFLRKDKSNTWRDVGNTKAREKTSQALREGAPDLRSPQQKSNAKEEQMSSPDPFASQGVPIAPSPSKSQVLGIRKHVDFSSGSSCFGTGMSLFPVGPSILGTAHSGEIDRNSKKMRLDAAMPPQVSEGPVQGGVPHFFGGGSQHAYFHGMSAPSFMNVAAPNADVGAHPHLVSSQSFAVSVSADDDDSRGEERHGEKSSGPRGPRLKLLKKRLQEEQSD